MNRDLPINLSATTIIARWLTPRVGQDPTQAARELVEELRREGVELVRVA